MRLLAVVLVALVIPTPAHAARRSVDRGLLLRVRAGEILVQELDGARERILVSKATRVVLNGKRARLRDLRGGDVVYVLHVGRRAATHILAFSP